MSQHHAVWLTGLALALTGCIEASEGLGSDEERLIIAELGDISVLPNNTETLAAHGKAASFHTSGAIDLNNEFFIPQGTNGRSCVTCHAPEDGWSIRPATVALMFQLTDGTHPLFANRLDTDTPTCDMSTVESRWNCTTMLRKGLFTRKLTPPLNRDYDVIAAADPFGVGTTATLWFFRRPLPTSDLRQHTVMWDAANTVGTVLRDGLVKQAAGNITGAQQGAPGAPELVGRIVDFEMGMYHAQTNADGVGSLTGEGARGGPELSASQPFVAGRFDLYDSWQDSQRASRRQIWRGQEVFNNVNVASGRRCGGCHSAANDGQNVNGSLFDIQTSNPDFGPGLAVYTIQSRVDGAIRTTTDPGRGGRNGRFADLNKFKTPSLRGLSSRAPYFHNGIAGDLAAVVKHYEVALGFDFTDQEEADLVAFLGAL